ncbi:HWE histidine kinase domain-containing protein [Skermanella stibiiresistens]|uniref:HWE histidine kinase domain-containing protein n=1 Tax=Skermanella stibiiresistens TaxID=913326 RepID=UPI0004B8199F|nr:HWE histidine kinase domain-containing protein [Skermanella stibiiresistens]
MIEDQVQDRARLLAEDIDRELARILAVGEVLALSESLTSDDLASFHDYATKVRDLLGTNVLLRDLASQQLVNTRVPWGNPLPRNPIFDADRAAISTRLPKFSNLLTGAVARTRLLIVVVPVIRNDEVKYLLSLTISLERLQSIFTPDRLPPGWIAGLIDRTGTIIARSKSGDELVGTKLPDEVWTKVRDVPEGVQHIANIDRFMSLQSYQRSEYSGWLVGVSVPDALVNSAPQRTLTLFAAGGLLLFLLGLAVALALARGLAMPITQLAAAARALGLGRPLSAVYPGVAEIRAVDEALRDTADLIGRRTADLRDSETRLRRVVEGAPFPAIVHAEDGEIIHVNRAWLDASGYSRAEIPTMSDWSSRAFHDNAGPSSNFDRLHALDRPLEEGEHAVVTSEGLERAWAFRSAPIGRDGGGRRLVVTMAVDLTERKDAEARLRLLMGEVDHRAKNALAVVQSIVILSRAESPADFAEVVQGRVAAIARAHTLLANTRWSGADLTTMIRQELEAHTTPGRMDISGVPVTIVATSAQAMSIVLHELTINAAKHGSLSKATGRVAVAFEVDQRNGTLVLNWEENGGPTVNTPKRRGFGTLIIERTIRNQLGGEEDRQWDPAGLRFRMVLPAHHFMTSGIVSAAPMPRPANDEPTRPSSGVRVLLVEDEALTALAMAHAVEEAGYQVLGPVGRAQDAIDMAQTTRPDVAVLDFNLLGQTSLPIARVLASMGVPFLFCTGYDSLNGVDPDLRDVTVLTKPVSPADLTTAISTLLTVEAGGVTSLR